MGSSPTSPLAGAPQLDLAGARSKGAQTTLAQEQKNTVRKQGQKYEADARQANSAADLAAAQRDATILSNEKNRRILEEYLKNPDLFREEIQSEISPKTLIDAMMRFITGGVREAGPRSAGGNLSEFLQRNMEQQNQTGAGDPINRRVFPKVPKERVRGKDRR